MSRRVVAAMSVAALAAGGILGSALAMQGGPTKISLSSEVGDHQQHTGGHDGTSGQSASMTTSHRSESSHRSRSRHGDRYRRRHEHMRRGRMVNGWSYTTLDDTADSTFNQLLGINRSGMIAGYYGSGSQGHPNQGYLLSRNGQQASFLGENYPGSVQTQVTGLNDNGVSVGFWSNQNTSIQTNDNFGFYYWQGQYHTVNFPTLNAANPPVNQLLGVNDQDIAVGFYTNSKGNNYGYEYSIHGHWFRRVVLPRWMRGHYGPSLTAAAINNRGDVAGFYTPHHSNYTYAFLRLAHGGTYKLTYPGATMTQAFGVNDNDEVVGAYTIGSGNNAQTYGFTWRPGYGWKSISDPYGHGSTTINGVNDQGELVGFYTGSDGNTHGMLVAPGSSYATQSHSVPGESSPRRSSPSMATTPPESSYSSANPGTSTPTSSAPPVNMGGHS